MISWTLIIHRGLSKLFSILDNFFNVLAFNTKLFYSKGMKRIFFRIFLLLDKYLLFKRFHYNNIYIYIFYLGAFFQIYLAKSAQLLRVK
jgi:hypothetical protein